MSTNTHSDWHLYRRLLWHCRPYWLYILGVFVLDLLGTPLGLLSPLPLKIAVDSAIGDRPLPRFLNALLPLAVTQSPTAVLGLAVGLLLGLAVFNQLYGIATSLLGTYTGEKLVLDFRAKLFRRY